MTEPRKRLSPGPPSRVADKVEEIREKRRNGAKLVSLAIEYEMDETWICKLCRGRRLASEGGGHDRA